MTRPDWKPGIPDGNGPGNGTLWMILAACAALALLGIAYMARAL